MQKLLRSPTIFLETKWCKTIWRKLEKTKLCRLGFLKASINSDLTVMVSEDITSILTASEGATLKLVLL